MTAKLQAEKKHLVDRIWEQSTEKEPLTPKEQTEAARTDSWSAALRSKRARLERLLRQRQQDIGQEVDDMLDEDKAVVEGLRQGLREGCEEIERRCQLSVDKLQAATADLIPGPHIDNISRELLLKAYDHVQQAGETSAEGS
jgi:hypothetical protein